MSRPIILPELPLDLRLYSDVRGPRIEAYARIAIELDRSVIVVTDEDVSIAFDAAMDEAGDLDIRAALESFAARKRGEA